jgi:PAS domain S-box-containing protein
MERQTQRERVAPAPVTASSDADRTELDALRATFDLAPVGIAHFDLSGRFIRVNARICEVLGHSPEELLQRTFVEITHPDDVSACVQLNAQLAAGELPSYRHEKRFLKADGTAVWVAVTVSAVRAPAGAIAFFVGVAEDIGDRRRIEGEVRRREAEFRALANGIPQLCWIADSSGRRLWYNQRWFEFTGQTPDQAAGHGWRERHHPEHIDRVLAGMRDAFARNAMWEDTYPLLRHDGEYRWFLVRAMPLVSDDGRAHRWFGTNTDITERLEMEATLKNVIGVVAHDLRNPVHTILMSVSALIELDLPEDERRKQLAVIRRSAHGTEALIRDLLDSHRMESGSFAIKAEPVSLAMILRESCESLELQAGRRGIAVHCELHEALPMVNADHARLTQVIANLTHNALKFTNAGSLTLRAVPRQDFVEVIIEDTGKGIAAADLARVFDRFWQADRTSRQGAGLGLGIAKGIIEAHGGRIWMDSELGKGTKVHFTVPVARG